MMQHITAVLFVFPPRLQNHLIEAAAESVYLTKDSLSALVEIYYSDLWDISNNLQLDQLNMNYGMIIFHKESRMLLVLNVQIFVVY